jgi:hypothetical protein
VTVTTRVEFENKLDEVSLISSTALWIALVAALQALCSVDKSLADLATASS